MIWNIILEELEKELSKIEFNRYIKNLEFDEKNSRSDIKILITNNKIPRNKFNQKSARLVY